jgi:hypothetical protein
MNGRMWTMTTKTIERKDIHQMVDALSETAIEKLAHYLDFLEYEEFKQTYPETDDNFYSPANMRWINESIEQMKQDKYVTKTFEELEQMSDSSRNNLAGQSEPLRFHDDGFGDYVVECAMVFF